MALTVAETTRPLSLAIIPYHGVERSEGPDLSVSNILLGGPGRLGHKVYGFAGGLLQEGVALGAQAIGLTPVAIIKRIEKILSDGGEELLDRLHNFLKQSENLSRDKPQECDTLRLLRKNCSKLTEWTIP
jgi:hypothetical protein